MVGQVLYIMQGPSGSGKSFLAKQISSGLRPLSVYICSTDFFFVENGVYNFNPKKLGENHQKCYEQVMKLLSDGFSVILDNTNIQCWECRDYVKFAQENNIPVVFIRVTGNFQNVHGVPQDKVDQMKARMEDLTVEKCLASKKPWEN